MISKLQYITQDLENISHAQLVKEACEAGINWIQLRVKEKSDAQYLQVAEEVKKVCDSHGATLIINDNVSIAKEINAHGVHLGKTDMKVSEARKILGNNFIIGATANTFEDIQSLPAKNVDYIGLGPFRFTTTKKKLSPVVGLEGYNDILSKCKMNNIYIPIVAIGGVTADDVTAIMKTGLHGIAISSYITNAKNKRETVECLQNNISSCSL